MIFGEPLVERHAGHDVGRGEIVDFAAGAGGLGGGREAAGQIGRVNECFEAVAERLVDAFEASQFVVGEIRCHHPRETED
jgi:hypothetical protein